MAKQILTQGNLRRAEVGQRFNRAEMHAYYIALITMPTLTYNRPALEKHA